jgi:hypothetical protein
MEYVSNVSVTDVKWHNNWQVNKHDKDFLDAYVGNGLSSLDFSTVYPKLKGLNLYTIPDNVNSSFQYLASDDAGLGKNVSLKQIFVWDKCSQTPVSLSYLPSVEDYEAYGEILDDFDYLSRAMPSLKTLIFKVKCGLFAKEELPMLENISKLEFLENLVIKIDSSAEGAFAFTDQEINALSRMDHLKNLTVNIMSYTKKKEVDRGKLQMLRDLLPNTRVEVNIKNLIPENLPCGCAWGDE